MLEYDLIDISEGIDAIRINDLFECDCWYFLIINFRFQRDICNGCHDLMEKAMNFNDVAIVFAKANVYRIRFWYMNKHEEHEFIKKF